MELHSWAKAKAPKFGVQSTSQTAPMRSRMPAYSACAEPWAAGSRRCLDRGSWADMRELHRHHLRGTFRQATSTMAGCKGLWHAGAFDTYDFYLSVWWPTCGAGTGCQRSMVSSRCHGEVRQEVKILFQVWFAEHAHAPNHTRRRLAAATEVSCLASALFLVGSCSASSKDNSFQRRPSCNATVGFGCVLTFVPF